MIKRGKSYEHLLDKRLDPDTMANEYAMDVSATVYGRMKELGLKKQDLAERLGASPSWVTKLLHGNQNITLKTIARLEEALDIDMTEGLRHPRKSIDADYQLLVEENRLLAKKESPREAVSRITLAIEGMK